MAVYRPIDTAHKGTMEDPIPWVYGMDCASGLYYSYNAAVYLCKADMKPCVWHREPPPVAMGGRGRWRNGGVTNGPEVHC